LLHQSSAASLDVKTLGDGTATLQPAELSTWR
jgi:hypothetical protein